MSERDRSLVGLCEILAIEKVESLDAELNVEALRYFRVLLHVAGIPSVTVDGSRPCKESLAVGQRGRTKVLPLRKSYKSRLKRELQAELNVTGTART